MSVLLDFLFKIGLAPLMKRDALMPDSEVTFDRMVENIPWIMGSPRECTARIHGNRSLELFALRVAALPPPRRSTLPSRARRCPLGS